MLVTGQSDLDSVCGQIYTNFQNARLAIFGNFVLQFYDWTLAEKF